MNKKLIKLTENRVRRNYQGGLGLDRFEGKREEKDSCRPEDWVASTVLAKNPGLDPIEDEGLAFVLSDGKRVRFTDLLKERPEFYLGREHVAANGITLGFLVKILDSAMRLHVQAHPTALFAAKHLDSHYGKLECYYVLACREGISPYIRLGFQHAPGFDEWRRIVLEQDIDAMDACFEKIPVKPGEVWYVPGGVPHAIGEGLTVIEVMEPTDLVVRCEFDREGIVVPPEARFMNRDPDFALTLFDMRQLSPAQVHSDYRVTPETLKDSADLTIDRLIGLNQTPCFEIRKITVKQSCDIAMDSRFCVAICVDGEAQIKADGEQLPLTRSSRFFVPAAVRSLRVELSSESDGPLELIVCCPGQTAQVEALET